MNLLEMNHIKKEFDGVGVIHDISLAVKEGEILSIISIGKRKIYHAALRHDAGAD